jgi:hypothetical protein
MNHQLTNTFAMNARHECQALSGAFARIAYEDLPPQIT